MADDPYRSQRERLVERLQREGRCAHDRTAAAMRAVPRHEFVPEDQRSSAYDDRPLPIGQGQTISAPHMVAMMLDLLDLEVGERVLEIGTGCGYHAAVTAEVVGPEHVYSVEVVPELAREAQDRLRSLGYADVSVRVGDGSAGWAEQAPFDAVYLTCATESIPSTLIEQVRPGGRLLAPVGDRVQELVLVRVNADGSTSRERHGGVRFVPMRDGSGPRH